MTSKFIKAIPEVQHLNGVQSFILTDQSGNIIQHDIQDPEKTASLVLSCVKQLFPIGTSNLNYSVFVRETKNDFFIFPVGNHYLGVVKEKDAETFDLADNIIEFLSELKKSR